MKHTKHISGYTWSTEDFCADCILEAFSGVKEDVGYAFSVEGVLDIVAGVMGVDRSDERSFDSSEFPKIILDWQVEEEDERCARCNERLR